MEKISNIKQIFFNKDELIIITSENSTNYNLPKGVKIIKEDIFNKVQNFIKNFNLEQVFAVRAENCTFTPEYWFDRIREVLTITNLKDKEDIINSMKALGFSEIKHVNKN